MAYRVYCLGLSRTGTTTFSDFLAKYNLNVIHYPSQMQLMGGQGDGASDIPVVPVYKDLDKMFRGSKFVYLTRENWTDQVEEYFIRKSNRPNQSATQVALRERVYGSAYWDRKSYDEAYKRHDEDVREYFKNRPEDLLIMSIVDGDSPKLLTDFLQLEDRGYSFPQSNARNNTWDKKPS